LVMLEGMPGKRSSRSPVAGTGGHSEVGRLRRLLLKHPREAFEDPSRIEAQWRGLRFTGPPDFARAVGEYEALLDLFGRLDIETLFLPRDDRTGLDSIYARDAAVVCDRGVILCNMGKEPRRGEPEAIGRFLRKTGLPILGRIEGDGRLEGGDLVWIDERTVAVGEGYRTNIEGIRQLRTLLGSGIEVAAVPLPHWNGPDDVLHLMSMLSPIDRDLALVHSRLLPVPFRGWLQERGIGLLEVPPEEYDGMACNVLALSPRRCLALAGNPATKRLLEGAGVEVFTYEGREISFKGSGGPTCLTRPLLRDPAALGPEPRSVPASQAP
jgi:arginine deiminase